MNDEGLIRVTELVNEAIKFDLSLISLAAIIIERTFSIKTTWLICNVENLTSQPHDYVNRTLANYVTNNSNL